MEPEIKANILMVDDRQSDLLSLESILGGLGQNLVKANSGEEALRHLLNQDFALILLDVQMPGMDGFETAVRIRERPKTATIPIIFITGIETTEIHTFKGYSLGAVDYLFKPILPEILKAKVKVFVDLFKLNEKIKLEAKQLEALNRELKTEIAERKRAQEEREKLIFELQGALANIKQLKGLLPICSSCKKIRNDKGYWQQVESYLLEHSDATFTHGICPDCVRKLYPEVDMEKE